MKTCLRCGETKPLDDYNRDRQKRDGRKGHCRICDRAQKNAHYKSNREVHLAYSRSYLERHPGRATENARRRRRENPQRQREASLRYRQRHAVRLRIREAEYTAKNRDKVYARQAVYKARKRGELSPASACEQCGHDFSVYRLEAHHEDYAKRLEVEWLCSRCHADRHLEVA